MKLRCRRCWNPAGRRTRQQTHLIHKTKIGLRFYINRTIENLVVSETPHNNVKGYILCKYEERGKRKLY